MTADWKADITRIAYWKQLAADKDQLGARTWHLPRVAATDAMIDEAESRAGVKFAAEYRDFLKHADGWPCFLIVTDLFGTKDFVSGRDRDVIALPHITEFCSEINVSPNEVYAVGASDTDMDIFLGFSPRSKFLPEGVVWLAGQEIDRYSSFSEFFSAMVNYNAQFAMQSAGKA